MNDTTGGVEAEGANAGANQSALTTILRPRAGLSIVKQVQQQQQFTERARPIKRKRKLIIDDQKVIPSDQMRQQLQDPSDIIRKPEMAPMNDAMMLMKENSSIDKLWNMPGQFFAEAPGMSNKIMAVSVFMLFKNFHVIVCSVVDMSYFPADIRRSGFASYRRRERRSGLLSGLF